MRAHTHSGLAVTVVVDSGGCAITFGTRKYDLFFFFAVFVFCCCSFHFNYALVALVIMRIIPILELLALFWLWLSGIVWPVGGSSRCGSCCYFFSGFGISFAFDYVFGIIQVLSLGPTLLPLPLSLLYTLFLWLYLELALDLYLNVLSPARVSVYLHFQLCCAGQHCHKGILTVPPPPLPSLAPSTYQVWLWLRLELFSVRYFNESI